MDERSSEIVPLSTAATCNQSAAGTEVEAVNATIDTASILRIMMHSFLLVEGDGKLAGRKCLYSVLFKQYTKQKIRLSSIFEYILYITS